MKTASATESPIKSEADDNLVGAVLVEGMKEDHPRRRHSILSDKLRATVGNYANLCDEPDAVSGSKIGSDDLLKIYRGIEKDFGAKQAASFARLVKILPEFDQSIILYALSSLETSEWNEWRVDLDAVVRCGKDCGSFLGALLALGSEMHGPSSEDRKLALEITRGEFLAEAIGVITIKYRPIYQRILAEEAEAARLDALYAKCPFKMEADYETVLPTIDITHRMPGLEFSPKILGGFVRLVNEAIRLQKWDRPTRPIDVSARTTIVSRQEAGVQSVQNLFEKFNYDFVILDAGAGLATVLFNSGFAIGRAGLQKLQESLAQIVVDRIAKQR